MALFNYLRTILAHAPGATGIHAQLEDRVAGKDEVAADAALENWEN